LGIGDERLPVERGHGELLHGLRGRVAGGAGRGIAEVVKAQEGEQIWLVGMVGAPVL
jgi:hypothetical protein